MVKIIGKVKTEIDYYKFASTCKQWEFNSCEEELEIVNFVELIRFIIDNNGLIVCGENSGEVMWADEIRFDYTSGEIYLPYISSDYKNVNLDSEALKNKYKRNVIAYNNSLNKYVIYSRGKFLEDYIYFIVEFEGSIQCAKASTVGMELFNKSELCKSAQELYRKYLRQSYGYTLCENDTLNFYELSKSKLNSLELKLINKLGLEYYGEYKDNEFSRNMCYKLQDLLKYYTHDELGIDITYNIRRFEFESELFCGISIGHEWLDWTRGCMTRFKYSKDYFCKYKENEFYFIFKKKWLDWV